MNEFEAFIKHNVRRRERYFFEGVDETPELPWSKPWNESLFIDALQKVKDDEWNAPYNERVWTFLHVGGSAPH